MKKCWSSECIFHSFFLLNRARTPHIFVRRDDTCATSVNCEISCAIVLRELISWNLIARSTLTIWNDFVNKYSFVFFPFSKFEKEKKLLIEEWKENANKNNARMRAWERATKRHNTIAIFCWPKRTEKKTVVQNDSSHISKQTNTKQRSRWFVIAAQSNRPVAPSENATIATATPTNQPANDKRILYTLWYVSSSIDNSLELIHIINTLTPHIM